MPQTLAILLAKHALLPFYSACFVWVRAVCLPPCFPLRSGWWACCKSSWLVSWQCSKCIAQRTCPANMPNIHAQRACAAGPHQLGDHTVLLHVQDMACDTFLKICNKCRRKFVVLQLQEREPFISELLNTLFETIHDLQPHQVWFGPRLLCAKQHDAMEPSCACVHANVLA